MNIARAAMAPTSRRAAASPRAATAERPGPICRPKTARGSRPIRGDGSKSPSRRPTRSASMPSSRIRARRSTCPTTAGSAGKSATAARAWCGGPSISPASSSIRRTRIGSSRWASGSPSPKTAARESFSSASGGSHGDWHDIWINPTNTKYSVGGDDGGLWYTYDGANRWWKANNLPVSQFYHVSVDDKDPYQVYGGLQDNSSWVGDQEYPGGITNSRWENLFGGDGFWAFADPSDPNFAYAEAQGGHVGRINRKTLEQRDIQPKGGYKEKLRYNWNTPIAMSPNERGTI